MVNRTKSKRSRYIKSRKFRKSGGENPTSEGTKKNFKNRLMGIKGRIMGSMPKPPSMKGSRIKNAFGKARGMFKNIPSLGKKKKQDFTGVVPAAPPVDLAQRKPVPTGPPPAGPVVPAAAGPAAAGPAAAAPAAAAPAGPAVPPAKAGDVPSVNLAEEEEEEDIPRPPSRVGDRDGANVGGKRNRYKKSKKGGRRTRKSRKLRRSRRR